MARDSTWKLQAPHITAIASLSLHNLLSLLSSLHLRQWPQHFSSWRGHHLGLQNRNNGSTIGWRYNYYSILTICPIHSLYWKFMNCVCCRGTSPSVAVTYGVVNWRHQFYFSSDPGRFSHRRIPGQTSQTTTLAKEKMRKGCSYWVCHKVCNKFWKVWMEFVSR